MHATSTSYSHLSPSNWQVMWYRSKLINDCHTVQKRIDTPRVGKFLRDTSSQASGPLMKEADEAWMAKALGRGLMTGPLDEWTSASKPCPVSSHHPRRRTSDAFDWAKTLTLWLGRIHLIYSIMEIQNTTPSPSLLTPQSGHRACATCVRAKAKCVVGEGGKCQRFLST